ncbi:MAG TPA: AbrB/MazE/SpoVT family DNA-binding domain-containing protein [Geminicoccus sp.]|jgi:bifunctional DNA-binding transcriptional regulator/antitoxin component of YhaV-PrlF toxin-antitoxin module|uniref:AbrB/MazE/SpoVT family DNA-binding domain-containing protein n=1 Tax=Geminicoccus sp. TaxID=2024832 RepID=UPI002E360C03|nr:AbrB/MazE/SpoVT family DNA-binding domain-containing protein [Geminicoccus sp.]HEX2525047.1 AbrB/MazE/SpoVT family DNA-binding domain-containing protein [Geminicoccus sp.]
MSNLRLHDHGWLALPAELRKQLGLQTGDRLQLELIEGALRLRPADQAAMPEVAQPALAVVVPDQPPAKRGRGRPRKQVQADPPVAEQQAELLLQPALVQPEQAAATAASTSKRSTRGLLPKLKVGGRRKSVPADAV